tara:strand:- start:347 stop:562 length:216 start_codon:yes stop_codon:yes gene_type:complete
LLLILGHLCAFAALQEKKNKKILKFAFGLLLVTPVRAGMVGTVNSTSAATVSSSGRPQVMFLCLPASAHAW